MKTIRLITFLAVALFTNGANAQMEEMGNVKKHIAELLKNDIMIWGPELNSDNVLPFWGHTKNNLVQEDRIVFRCINCIDIIIYFSDIIHDKITIYFDAINKFDRVYFSYHLSIVIAGKGNTKKFFDDLIFIQNQLIEEEKSQLVLFEALALQYRALEVKPPISEEQRKYIVQANGFNDEKQYTKAIELYKKAIDVDQTAYPAAYSNLALLSAQIGSFGAAIYYMKKYLLLVPEAEDARSAQDKIYLWEAKLGE